MARILRAPSGSPGGQGQVLQCNADLYELGPLGLQRRPESAVRIAAEVVGLHEDAHLAYLANVPEGRPVGSPAVYAVIRPLGHRTVSARNSPPALMTTTHPAGGSGGRVIDRKSTRLNSSHPSISY